VGPSGSGKSTIFQLIERLYNVNYGDIKVGSQSIYNLALPEWREKIAYVMQDNSMMNETIKNNILYGITRNVSNTEIIRYSKLANAHDFISKLDKDYNNIVGERGIK